MDIEKIQRIMRMDPDEATEELLESVEKYYGEIPYILQFMKETPELLVPKILYDSAIIREFKRLDPKTVELISIGVSAAIRCDHCLRMHIRVAEKLGISREEIFDAILIAGTLSNATVLAYATRALDSEEGVKRGSGCAVCDIGCGGCDNVREKFSVPDVDGKAVNVREKFSVPGVDAGGDNEMDE